jgi:radical SAM superfamily enzyme
MKETPLASVYARGACPLLSMEDYAECVVDVLERLPSDVVVHRVTADCVPEILIAPQWINNKGTYLRLIDEIFAHRTTRQGFLA